MKAYAKIQLVGHFSAEELYERMPPARYGF